VQVQIILPPGAAARELQLPVWNALYQVRDFAQFVNWVRAKDRAGNTLPIEQANDSRWQLESAAEGAMSSIKSMWTHSVHSARSSIPITLS